MSMRNETHCYWG